MQNKPASRARADAGGSPACPYCGELGSLLYSNLEDREWCAKCDMPPRNDDPLSALIYDPKRDGILPTIAELAKNPRHGQRPVSHRRTPARRRNPLSFKFTGAGVTLTMLTRRRTRKLRVTWPEWDEVVAAIERKRA